MSDHPSTCAQVIMKDPADDGACLTAARRFVELGFEVQRPFAGSFAIVADAATFRDVFGAVPRSGARELPLARLPGSLRNEIRAVTGTEPPEFGPGTMP